MKKHDHERVEQTLKNAFPPISARVGAELRQDLWPTMLKRLEARPSLVPWFDWALLAVVAAWLVFFPGAIPVLLYHL
jgi:hypothetical protein